MSKSDRIDSTTTADASTYTDVILCYCNLVQMLTSEITQDQHLRDLSIALCEAITKSLESPQNPGLFSEHIVRIDAMLQSINDTYIQSLWREKSYKSLAEIVRHLIFLALVNGR